MRELLINIGHDASAALVVDGKLVAAASQERFDRKKGSSASPIDAIMSVVGGARAQPIDHVGIAHWMDEFPRGTPTKYLDEETQLTLAALCPDVQDYSWCNTMLTHHDAHARHAVDWAVAHDVDENAYVLVLDGFGYRREVMSKYRLHDDRRPVLSQRAYGYENSFGLFYQFATGFLGLKEMEDEYKLLGYAAGLPLALDAGRMCKLYAKADSVGFSLAETCLSPRGRQATYPIVRGGVNAGDIDVSRRAWNTGFAAIVSHYARELDEHSQRVVVAAFAQRALESGVLALMSTLGMFDGSDVVCTGGVFYNVQLNRRVSQAVNRAGGRCFVPPLAGDVGTCLGMRIRRASFPFGLITAPRDDRPTTAGVPDDHFAVAPSMPAALHGATVYLSIDRFANVVGPVGEFGPRALGYTSTLALPTRENADALNVIAGRNSVMPFAPICTNAWALENLDGVELTASRGVGEYMIMAYALKRTPDRMVRGACHLTADGEWTCRPQIVRESHPLHGVVETFGGVLINTSFNYHGEPIVHSAAGALETHRRMSESAPDAKRVGTWVVQP